jgi:4-hydroxybenzoate polyprenyltransferase
MLRAKPWQLFMIPLWLLRGRAFLKAKLANIAMLNWQVFPINDEVMRFVKSERASGRQVLLVTASDEKLASSFAEHLQVFDQVIASDGKRNLAGKNKASTLTELYGMRGFDYIGNCAKDLPVWANARKAVVVTGSRHLVENVRQVAEIDKVISAQKSRPADYFRMLRVHQWLKNLLVFVAAAAAHRIGEPKILLDSLLAFVAFSFCASSVYILNDLFDLESDRRHPRKKTRPLAASRISILHGVILMPILLTVSIAISLSISFLFTGILVGYFVLTLSYSMVLKRQVIVDVMMLAGLYTIRVIGGACATYVKPSFWLLAFSMFIFLSLALVKRYAELDLSSRQKTQILAGRGYWVEDLPVLLALGVASGFGAVLIVALYINNPDIVAVYPAHIWLWFVPGLLLYWVSRLWMKTHRREMHDDPVVFTARDWQSLTVVALSALCFVLAATMRPINF